MKYLFTYGLFILYLMVYLKCNAQTADPNQTPFAYGISLGVYSSSANPKLVGIIFNKKPVAGFSLGGVASFRRKTYFFETGLNYMSEGYAYSTTVESKNNVNKVSNEYKFYSIMLPLKLAVPIRSKYGRHLPSFALNLALPTKQLLYQTIEYNNAPLTKNVYNVSSDYKVYKPSFSLAYGLEFDMDVTYAIRVEPTFQFTILNANAAQFKTNISNIGLKCNLLFLR